MDAGLTAAGLQALVAKLEIFAKLTPDDRRALSGLLDRPRMQVARGRDLVVQGGARGDSYVLLAGWAARHKTLPDGRRQILSFLTAGDVVGLFAAVAPTATSTVTALSDLGVLPFAPGRVPQAMGRSPRLGAALFWSAAREQEILA